MADFNADPNPMPKISVLSVCEFFGDLASRLTMLPAVTDLKTSTHIKREEA